MWTVLIVEDERFVRESIRQIVNWEEQNFKIIGEASNGVEALEFITENRPHLVVTDIMMPIMNGVDLLKEARKKGINSKFIMLTCMNEFEYVQQALEYGASNYILKLSMSVDTLKEALEKVNKELKQEFIASVHHFHSFYKEIWDKIWDKMKDREDGLPVFNDSVSFLKSTHVLTMISVLHGPKNWNKEQFERLILTEDNDNAIIHLFTSHGHTTAFFWTLHPVRLKMKTSLDYPIVYTRNVNIDHLQITWEKMMRDLDNFWYNVKSNVKSVKETHCLFKFWKQEKELYYRFEKMDKSKCIFLFETIMEEIKLRFIPMVTVKEAISRIAKTLGEISQQQWNIRKLLYASSHDELKSLFLEQLNQHLDNFIMTKGYWTDHPEVNKVIQYMLENYHLDISVRSMAKYVSMDETYFSHLFKKKTGETLIKYLQKIRVYKAKYELSHTDLSIQEIGLRVGFQNTNYFNRIFKRFTASTPGEYRKKFKSIS